jgi:FkbM family methyltransferase
MTHPSAKIKKILSGWLESNKIEMIWEIGSRDGEDAKVLLEAFPNSSVVCFEPNPDTYALVERVSLNSGGRIKACNIALSEQDGRVLFYKIDRSRTRTSWVDGNPGASSLFLANGSYTIEEYVQIPVEVECKKASTLIESNAFRAPDIIWVDVQGAELLVLRGFNQFLAVIGSIYIELSLKAVYHNQPLANDVIKFLSKNFLWHSVINTGTWQFDALLLNRRMASPSLYIRHYFFVWSLKSSIGLGIKRSFSKRLFHYLSKHLNSMRIPLNLKS